MLSNLKVDLEYNFVRFGAENLFTNMPPQEATPIIKKRVKDDEELHKRTSLCGPVR